jgi:hypothetical protein
MITCVECKHLYSCNVTKNSAICSDFDRGNPESDPVVETDVQELWTALGKAIHRIGVLEDRLNSILAAVIRAAQDQS